MFCIEKHIRLLNCLNNTHDNLIRTTSLIPSFPDFDGDNQISLDDLIEAVHRLTWTKQDEHESIDKAEAERIVRMVSFDSI